MGGEVAAEASIEDLPVEVAPTEPADGSEKPFDFDGHRERAEVDYRKVRNRYVDFAQAVNSIVKACLDGAQISVHSIEYRAKSVESFAAKAAKALEDNPNAPKYDRPLEQITDLSAVRIITFFLSTV